MAQLENDFGDNKDSERKRVPQHLSGNGRRESESKWTSSTVMSSSSTLVLKHVQKSQMDLKRTFFVSTFIIVTL